VEPLIAAMSAKARLIPREAPPGGIHRPVNQGVIPPQLTTELAHPDPANGQVYVCVLKAA